MNHLTYLLKQILSYEPSLDDKLNMLTEIGLMANSEKLFKATEEVRNELVSYEENQKVRSNDIRSHEHPNHISNFQL
jgi:hypothetical protein